MREGVKMRRCEDEIQTPTIGRTLRSDALGNNHVVELNKPIYMGMSILDYSKIHMYSFHYDVLKPKYDDKTKLVYTDTDSYVIKVETDDIYEDFEEINEYMDFSDYPAASKL